MLASLLQLLGFQGWTSSRTVLQVLQVCSNFLRALRPIKYVSKFAAIARVSGDGHSLLMFCKSCKFALTSCSIDIEVDFLEFGPIHLYRKFFKKSDAAPYSISTKMGWTNCAQNITIFPKKLANSAK